ncbi:conserved hypothetical protein [Histoplasma capsulatum var. duboisii H88]|uniref:Uncharacterized protein n=1 Tax=Ajellomyces capsulatus (strain H88) TaxID=544711 RepID=F0UJ10_AJEC8|nr:conserved hypothetical protein [Histoplasma capsulatum var. duboisii H88]QSS56311.1 hypothetical protein I7I53_04489 [Histoplasma capsulatum var. duboisii H88]
MKVAEILSDLTSLRACGHAEALALVNVHKTTANSDPQQQSWQQTEQVLSPNIGESTPTTQSEDLRRAKDLVELHNDIKLKQLNRHNGGLNEELQKARRDVDRVLQELG